ncbi:unnamed protein product [Orchesella dallaii]|uniref:Uncharacterized protein n=1 Tax=Orchesella dallaii TaxID=48710 RepID=A0ABP1R2M3_9HEXA
MALQELVENDWFPLRNNGNIVNPQDFLALWPTNQKNSLVVVDVNVYQHQSCLAFSSSTIYILGKNLYIKCNICNGDTLTKSPMLLYFPNWFFSFTQNAHEFSDKNIEQEQLKFQILKRNAEELLYMLYLYTNFCIPIT